MTTPENGGPHFGFTRRGLAVHAATADHLPRGSRAQRFNAWLAVRITKLVGSMWCAYAFAALALYGLPAALRPGGEGLVSWIAQTFLQLVLLSIIIVGQSVQSQASDARAAKTFEDAEAIRAATAIALDRLDADTEGGIRAVLDAVRARPAAVTVSGSLPPEAVDAIAAAIIGQQAKARPGGKGTA